jgi:hypothetical protein
MTMSRPTGCGVLTMPNIQIDTGSVRPHWPWLDRIVAARATVMILVSLGILTFAAVGEMAKKCSREPNSITDQFGFRITDQFGRSLTDGQKHLECRTVWGDFGADIR